MQVQYEHIDKLIKQLQLLQDHDEQLANQPDGDEICKDLVCAALIEENVNQLSFQCFDCSKDLNHCLCQECFLKGDHFGHKVLYFNHMNGGVCDCGDLNLTTPLFCKIHKNSLVLDTFQLISKVENKYDQVFLEDLRQLFSQTFTVVFQTFQEYHLQIYKNQDIAPHILSSLTRNNKINPQFKLYLDKIIEFTNKNRDLLLILGREMTTISDYETRHDCENNQVFKIQKDLTKCKCTLLENIFRFMVFFDKEVESSLEQLLIRLFINKNFKYHLVQTFCQSLRLLWIDNYSIENRIKSLAYQYGGSEYINLILSSQQWINSCSNMISQGIENIDNPEKKAQNQLAFFPSSLNFYITHKLAKVHFQEYPKNFSKILEIFRGLFYLKEKQFHMLQTSNLQFAAINSYEKYFRLLINNIQDVSSSSENSDYFLSQMIEFSMYHSNKFLEECTQQQQRQNQTNLIQNDGQKEDKEDLEKNQTRKKQEEQNQKLIKKSDSESEDEGQSSLSSSLQQQQQQQQQQQWDFGGEVMRILHILRNPNMLMPFRTVINDSVYYFPVLNSGFRILQALFSLLISQSSSIEIAVERFYKMAGLNPDKIESVIQAGVRSISRSLACFFFYYKQLKVPNQDIQYLLFRYYISSQEGIYYKDLTYIQFATIIAANQNAFFFNLEWGILEFLKQKPLQKPKIEKLLAKISQGKCKFKLEFETIRSLILSNIFCNDLCLLNSALPSEHIIDIPWVSGIVKSVVIQAFQFQSNYAFGQLKHFLQQMGLGKGLEFQNFIKEIVSVEDNVVQIKEQFKSIIEPIYVETAEEDQLQQEYIQNINEKITKPKDFDSILGNQINREDILFPSKSNPLLDQISQNLVNSDYLFEIIFSSLEQSIFLVKYAPNVLQVIYSLCQRNFQNRRLLQVTKHLEKLKFILEQLKFPYDEVNLAVQHTIEMLEQTLQNASEKLDATQSNKESTMKSEEKIVLNQQAAQARTQVLNFFRIKSEDFMDFMKFNDEDKEKEQLIQSQNDEPFCVICKLQGTEKDLLYIPVYYRSDNLRKNYQQPQFGEGMKFQPIDKIFITCNHFVHGPCLDKAGIQQNIRKEFKSNNQILFQMEKHCPLCKLCSNLLIPILDQYSKGGFIGSSSVTNENAQIDDNQKTDNSEPVETEIQLQKQIGKNSLDQGQIVGIVSQIQTKIGILNNVYSMHNESKSGNDTENDYDSDDEIDDALLLKCLSASDEQELTIIQNLDSGLKFTIEKAFVYGIDKFITSDLRLAKNLFNLKNYMVQIMVPEQKRAYEKDLDNQMQCLSELSQNFSRLCADMMEFGSYSFDFILNEFLTVVQNISSEQQINFFSEYSQHLLQLIFSLLLILRTMKQSGFKSLEQCQNLDQFWQTIRDEKLKNEISIKENISFMLPYFKLVGVILLIISQGNQQAIFQRIYTQSSDEECLDSMNKIFKNKIFQFEPNLDIIGKFFEQFTKRFVQQQMRLLENFLSRNPCAKFSLSALDVSFGEFHRNHFFQMCYLCKSYPKLSQRDLYVCLLCGAVMCNSICYNSIEKQEYNDKIGNLNRHAREMHEKKTFFINLARGDIIILDSPLSVFYSSAFFDSFGQSFSYENGEDPSVQWNDCQMDPKLLKHIEKICYLREIPYELRRKCGDQFISYKLL